MDFIFLTRHDRKFLFLWNKFGLRLHDWEGSDDGPPETLPVENHRPRSRQWPSAAAFYQLQDVDLEYAAAGTLLVLDASRAAGGKKKKTPTRLLLRQ